MDTTFWAGIVIGTIFSFATNIVAQRTDSYFVKILEKLKLRNAERRSARENTLNNFANKLMRYPSLGSGYFIAKMTMATFMLLTGLMGNLFLTYSWIAHETLHQVNELGIKPSDVRINALSEENLAYKLGIVLGYVFMLIGVWTFIDTARLFARMNRSVPMSEPEHIV